MDGYTTTHTLSISVDEVVRDKDLLCFASLVMAKLLYGVAILCLTLNLAAGFFKFTNEIPNGDKVKNPCNGEDWLGVGHRNQGGSGDRSPFGLDVEAILDSGKTLVWTKALCMKDSDGDGRSNGAELGDPNCDWSIGESPKTGTTGHPGICEPVTSSLCRSKNIWPIYGCAN